MTPVLAWHFVDKTLRDGSKIPKDGVLLKHPGEVVLCESGLHGSKRLIDALQYAPGNTLCRTEHSGVIEYQEDKLASSERKILWRIDATKLLQDFARDEALRVAHLWPCPEVVMKWLKTGDESLRDEARRAAYAATYTATHAASTYAAARAADYAAAAAHAASTYAAARNSAIYAAINAVNANIAKTQEDRKAYKKLQNRRLTARVMRLYEKSL